MLLRKFIIRLSVILILFLSVAINADAAELEPNNIDFINPGLKTNALNINISNFNKVDENYYRGAQPNNKDLENLVKLGIKTVIDLRYYNPEDYLRKKSIVEGHGLNYINIPMHASKPPSSLQIARFFSVINKRENLPVFVHCMQGKDRTGIMTALYRIKYHGWDCDKAYNEMKEKGYHHFFYPAQKDFLYKYIKSEGKASPL